MSPAITNARLSIEDRPWRTEAHEQVQDRKDQEQSGKRQDNQGLIKDLLAGQLDLPIRLLHRIHHPHGVNVSDWNLLA
jgi:hypothetical protein